MTNQDMSDDGEIVDGEILEPIDSGSMVKIARTEIDAQIATAKAYPRNVTKLRQELQALVTIDEDTAEECIYALPRGNKFIKGPSARFADALISFWGNARSGAYVTDVNREDGYVEAIGSFQDVERNVIRQRRVRRGIKNNRGQVYNADMINMTGNAACVIAERNAILNGIPKSLWGPVYDRAFAVVAGGTQSLGDKISRAKKAFMAMGIAYEQVLDRLGYGTDESKVTPDDVVTLRGMLTALKTGEETAESLFGRGAGAGPAHEMVKNPLKDDAPLRGNMHDVNMASTVIDSEGNVRKFRDADAVVAPVIDQRFGPSDQLFNTLAEWSESTAKMPRPKFPSGKVQRQPATSQNDGSANREQTESSASVRDQDHVEERSEAGQSDAARIQASEETAEHDADGVVHDTGPAENNAQPAATSGASTGSKTSAPEKPYTDGDTYDGWMRDQIDAANSRSGVTEPWGATRADRAELLTAEQIDSLNKYKEAKLKKLKGGA